MTYRVLGLGRPLILVPGLASTYRGYAPTLLRLSRRFRTVVFDYPGEHRDDGARLRRIEHGHLVDDLFSLADHLECERPSLFGLSFGSTVVLGALVRRPRRFSRVVLQGGFARRRLLATERAALSLGRWLPGMTSNVPFHASGLAVFNRSAFPPGRPDLWAFYAEQNGLTPMAGLAHRLDLLHRLDLRPSLGKIPNRLLLIHGADDRIIPTSSFEELRAGLRRATGLLIPGMGHQPHYTHAEQLAGLVGDYLATDRQNRA